MGQVQTTRESEKVTLSIANGGTVTSTAISLDHKKEMAYFLVHLPASFVGVLFPVVSDAADGPFEVCYNSSGTLIYAETSGKILPAWYALDAECLYPAHYVKFYSATATSGTAGTAQSAAREIRVMGLS